MTIFLKVYSIIIWGQTVSPIWRSFDMKNMLPFKLLHNGIQNEWCLPDMTLSKVLDAFCNLTSKRKKRIEMHVNHDPTWTTYLSEIVMSIQLPFNYPLNNTKDIKSSNQKQKKSRDWKFQMFINSSKNVYTFWIFRCVKIFL